jgi:uncharacterized protein (DUF433 family)
MNYQDIITIEPDKRSGKPCIRGLRMTVTDVLEYLAGGMTPEEIVAEFPDLTLSDIRACLAFAADRERKLAVVSSGANRRDIDPQKLCQNSYF